MVSVTLDGKKVEAVEGELILEVAMKNGIYIPNLCYYPNLSPIDQKPANFVFRGKDKIENQSIGHFDGCGICVVKIFDKMKGEFLGRACATPVGEGMEIITISDELKEIRREKMEEALRNHFKFCITCKQSHGCDRIQCINNYSSEEICCDRFQTCEFRKIADYLKIKDFNDFERKNLPIVNEGLFQWDFNFCIGCLRCVRACREIVDANALNFVIVDGAIVVGRTEESAKDSGCKFCGVCVDVCPTGVVKYTEEKLPENKWRRQLEKKVMPPSSEVLLEFVPTNLGIVPESEGVLKLYDQEGEIIYIKGTPNLREELKAQMDKNRETKFFEFEKFGLFTIRESELLQEYLQEHGHLPKQNDELEELF
nr:2Fe-2S iron-sulfur cluster-binding protein [Candidatus Freyarchaeota archaeon]